MKNQHANRSISKGLVLENYLRTHITSLFSKWTPQPIKTFANHTMDNFIHLMTTTAKDLLPVYGDLPHEAIRNRALYTGIFIKKITKLRQRLHQLSPEQLSNTLNRLRELVGSATLSPMNYEAALIDLIDETKTTYPEHHKMLRNTLENFKKSLTTQLEMDACLRADLMEAYHRRDLQKLITVLAYYKDIANAHTFLEIITQFITLFKKESSADEVVKTLDLMRRSIPPGKAAHDYARAQRKRESERLQAKAKEKQQKSMSVTYRIFMQGKKIMESVRKNPGKAIMTGLLYQSTAVAALDPFIKVTRSIYDNFFFAETLGGPNDDQGYSFIQIPDGSYVGAGWTSVGSNSDILVIKITGNGTVEWANKVGSPGALDQAYSIAPAIDGGYFASGFTGTLSAGSYDLFIGKWANNGSLMWANSCGGTGREHGNSVIATTDGGCLVTGWTDSSGAGRDDGFLIKFRSTGAFDWARTFGGSTGDDYGFSVIQTMEGGYAVGGRTGSYGNGLQEAFLSKWTNVGNMSWAQSFGGSRNDEIYSLVQAADGSYIGGGITDSFGPGDSDILLVKWGVNGTFRSANRLGGSGDDTLLSINPSSQNGYIMSGYTSSFGTSGRRLFIGEWSSNETLNWMKTMRGTSGDDTGNSVARTLDNGYALFGATQNFGAGLNDILFAKLDSDGDITDCNITQRVNPSVNSVLSNSSSSAIPFTVRTWNPTVQTWSLSSQNPTLSQSFICSPIFLNTATTGLATTGIRLTTGARLTTTTTTTSATSTSTTSTSSRSTTGIVRSSTTTSSAASSSASSTVSLSDTVVGSTTLPLPDSRKSTEGNLLPVIIGASVGGCALITGGGIVTAFWFFKRRKRRPIEEASVEMREKSFLDIVSEKLQSEINDFQKEALESLIQSVDKYFQDNYYKELMNVEDVDLKEVQAGAFVAAILEHCVDEKNGQRTFNTGKSKTGKTIKKIAETTHEKSLGSSLKNDEP